MKNLVLRFFACVIAMALAAYLLPGIHAESLGASLMAGVMLGVVYMVLRPIAKLLLGVFNWLTLGLLGVLLDAWLVQLAGTMVSGFQVQSFLWALAASVLVNALRELFGAMDRK